MSAGPDARDSAPVRLPTVSAWMPNGQRSVDYTGSP